MVAREVGGVAPAGRATPRPGATMRKLRDVLVSDNLVISVILVNAASLFAGSWLKDGTLACAACGWLDWACTVFFVVEAGLKIGRDRFAGYWLSGWNRFDFVIIALSLPSLMEPLGLLDTRIFSVFLVLRLGRLFRLFRILRFIPDHAHMMIGIRRALRASVGVFIAIVIVNFVLAIGGSMLFGQYAPEHFGNPLLAIYSTFKVFTVEGWYDIPDAIAADAQSDLLAVFVRIYFVMVVLVGGILGLSLANAVFVDEMTADNTDKLESKVDAMLEEIRALRAELDARDPGARRGEAPPGQ
jgi:voltage-gated sodium channel